MINFLKQIPLFATLKDEELEAIYQLSLNKKCPKDTIILLEDEEGDTLFIIITGKVKVTTFSETGKEVTGKILKFDGRPITPEFIVEKVREEGV